MCQAPLPKACFCPKQSPEVPETTALPSADPQQDLAPRRPVWFSTGSETVRRLSAEAPERLAVGRGGQVEGAGLWAQASLGQGSAESHDGQAEEGAEVGRGLGR